MGPPHLTDDDVSIQVQIQVHHEQVVQWTRLDEAHVVTLQVIPCTSRADPETVEATTCGELLANDGMRLGNLDNLVEPEAKPGRGRHCA
jgi:hypothetical protein